MDLKYIKKTVIEIVAETVCIPQSEVSENSRFNEDLGFDSLDIFNFNMKLEEVFGVHFPSQENLKFVTVWDVIAFIVDSVCNKDEKDVTVDHNDTETQIELVKKLLKSGVSDDARMVLEKQFPEAVESMDERIRKALIEVFTEKVKDGFEWKDGIPNNAVLSWLERQKEPTDGDFARGYDCGYECCLHSHGAEWFEKHKEQNPITTGMSFNPDDYEVVENGNATGLRRKQKEQKPTIIIPKFRIGDTIRLKGTMSEYIIKSIDAEGYHGNGWRLPISAEYNYELIKSNSVDWSEEDKMRLNSCIRSLHQCGYMNCADFLKHLPERFNLPPKQELKEQNLAEWNIKNAKVGDIIYTSSTACSEIFIFKEIENGLVRCFCSYDSEDGFCTRSTHYIGLETDNYKIATVQQCIKLFYIIAKNGYLWNPHKKDLIKIANSAEWSEEDEKCIKDIIDCLEYLKREDTERQHNGDQSVNPDRYADMIAKLKSLRPQPQYQVDLDAIVKREYARGKEDGYWEGVKAERENTKTFHYESPKWPPKMPDLPTEATTNEGVSIIQPHWKPSEEQMQAILTAQSVGSYGHRKALAELYNDLNKLM